jgi:hypothetical protein
MKVIVNVCSIIELALTFLENPENKNSKSYRSYTINNNVYNLEWATHKEQSIHKLKSTKLRWVIGIWRVDKNTDEK